MAVLYEDQYRKITELGADETFVLSHLAHGYDEKQIETGLTKRRDRDSQDDVPQLMQRIYRKLGIAEHERASVKWQKAGKLYLSFTEMEREKTAPRRGNAPIEEPSRQHADNGDDVPQYKPVAPAHRNGVFQGPGHVNGLTAAPPKPPSPSAPPDHTAARMKRDDSGVSARAKDVESYVCNMHKLKKRDLRILQAFTEKNDVDYVANKVGLSASSVRVYLGGIYAVLGDTSRAKGKIHGAIEAYKLFVSRESGSAEASQAHAPEVPAAPAEPSERPEPQHNAGKSASSHGMVVNLTDPSTIADVACAVSKDEMSAFRERGYRVEHVVVPEKAGPDSRPITYVFVKRS
jgi:hypothetical protein